MQSRSVINIRVVILNHSKSNLFSNLKKVQACACWPRKDLHFSVGNSENHLQKTQMFNLELVLFSGQTNQQIQQFRLLFRYIIYIIPPLHIIQFSLKFVSFFCVLTHSNRKTSLCSNWCHKVCPNWLNGLEMAIFQSSAIFLLFSHVWKCPTILNEAWGNQ